MLRSEDAAPEICFDMFENNNEGNEEKLKGVTAVTPTATATTTTTTITITTTTTTMTSTTMMTTKTKATMTIMTTATATATATAVAATSMTTTSIATANASINLRKCAEGQLSSSMANSCLSCKSANRTSEMSQEDNGPCWDNLPSVILQEIFSYLSHDSRIKASQACRNWRYALFHPSFWKRITFTLKDEDSISWARFLADCFGLSVHDVTIRCDIPSCCIKETSILLKKLSCNRQLKKLFLELNNNTFEWPIGCLDEDDDNLTNCTPLMKIVVKIVETSNCLEALSLGCIEELAASASVILEPLRLHHAKHLTHLSLASVKDDPERYDFLELDDCIFASFTRLCILTLDYDFVSDVLLKALNSGTLERFVIHVHGWNDDYTGTTNNAWQCFVQKNPRCELRLNLIHSYVGVEVLDTEILQPAMPLAHLKVLFCESVNIGALHRLRGWYSHTLKSLMWIDSMDLRRDETPATYDPNDPDSPDPLVLVAWQCTKLVEIVFIGHKYYEENLLAIARLRGNMLKLLVFAERDIVSDTESWHKTEAITHEIQEIMGRRWSPMSDSELPAVVMNPFEGDSREVIMPLVLLDQK